MKKNKASFLGEELIKRGLISEEELNKALQIQEESGGLLGEILVAEGFIKMIELFYIIAEKEDLSLGSNDLEICKKLLDPDLAHRFEVETLVIHQFFPINLEEKRLKVFVSNQENPKVDELLTEEFGELEIQKIIATSRDIRFMLEEVFKAEMVDEAVNGLFYRSPKESASTVFTSGQIIFFLLIIALSAFLAYLYPIEALKYFLYFFNILFLASILFKFVLSIVGSFQEKKNFISQEEIDNIDEHKLPIYSILVPVYKEPEVIDKLISSLKNLDYPKSKLDVLFLFEEGDLETIEAAKKASPPDNWSFIYIPDSLPKTKPKACNYGLKEARGELLTIYDAEDMPEADQLKKAYLAFQKSDDKVICFQSALNYFNRDDNILTKLFTLEYSYWFDYMLPGLDALKLPIPLGGTSNHFKIEKLRELGSWDPYNVTEDADLGIRANARGYRVGVLNSTTYEEANNKLSNWINQRSRWLKGYLQTFLVHNRQPLKFIQKVGFRGWFTLQIFIGGSVLTHLVAPFFWFLFIFWLLSGTPYFGEFYYGTLLQISLLNLLFGNFLGIYLATIAVFKRKYYSLIIYALLNPIYYLLQSAAAWKALYQLFANPFYWEKTQHGLTSKEVNEND